MKNFQFDFAPGSFRDPEGGVFFYDNKVYRTLNNDALSRMRDLFASQTFELLTKENKVIPTTLEKLNISKQNLEVLHHHKVPVVTYPYEWTFDMLKDAALTQLHINKYLIQSGFILKDGSAFNCLYNKGIMYFIDILSINKKDKSIWEGYSQFCQHFLFPLLISSYKKIPLKFLWKGTLTGTSLEVARSFFNFQDLFKPGIFKHLILQKTLADSLGENTSASLVQSQKSNLSNPTLLPLIKNLESVISGLKNSYKKSTWSNYEESNSYINEERKIKHGFISAHISKLKPNRVVDLGANAGEYSKIAAQHANEVIALDFDEACVNKIYLDIKNSKDPSLKNIIPMVGNLMELSPDQGWQLHERSNQLDRIKSDFFLALALIHHICITENVPLENFVLFLKRTAPKGIVEWVDIDDDMVQFMLRHRRNIFPDYRWENFRKILERYGTIQDIVETHNGKRKLCFVSFEK